MQITLPVPISVLRESRPSKAFVFATGSKTLKFFTAALLPEEVVFLISIGENTPFW